jgi:hypothetical protein
MCDQFAAAYPTLKFPWVVSVADKEFAKRSKKDDNTRINFIILKYPGHQLCAKCYGKKLYAEQRKTIQTFQTHSQETKWTNVSFSMCTSLLLMFLSVVAAFMAKRSLEIQDRAVILDFSIKDIKDLFWVSREAGDSSAVSYFSGTFLARF